MSNGVYVGSGETAHKVAGMYIGVDGLARKVVKGYIGADGVARQFYSAAQPFSYTYTGAHTESEITIDGVAYTVLTITSSGTLSVTRAISADVWLCGGGADGKRFLDSYAGGGGGGGYVNSGTLFVEASLAITVPSAGGIADCGGIIANPGSSGIPGDTRRGTDGGSGGGEGGSNSYSSQSLIGKGAGISTVPTQFGLMQAHCAGGAGGTYLDYQYGGNGGSNGSDGYEKTLDLSSGNKGGAVGGGNGNSSATFYGGGGGGANCRSNGTAFAGSGYQGVVYVRWKKEDAA